MSNFNKGNVIAALMERLNNVNYPKKTLVQLMAYSALEHTDLCQAIKNWNTAKKTPDEVFDLITDEMVELFGEEFGLSRVNIVAALPANKYIQQMREHDKKHATKLSDRPMQMMAKDSFTKETKVNDEVDEETRKAIQEADDAMLCELLSRTEDMHQSDRQSDRHAPSFPGIAAPFNRIAPAYARGPDPTYFDADLESGAHVAVPHASPEIPRASSDIPPFERRAPPPRDPNVMQFAKR